MWTDEPRCNAEGLWRSLSSSLSLLALKLSEGRGRSAEVWVFEIMLPGCRVWECELLLTAKMLYEELLSGATAITTETSSFRWYGIGSHRFDSSSLDSSHATKILQICHSLRRMLPVLTWLMLVSGGVCWSSPVNRVSCAKQKVSPQCRWCRVELLFAKSGMHFANVFSHGERVTTEGEEHGLLSHI